MCHRCHAGRVLRQQQAVGRPRAPTGARVRGGTRGRVRRRRRRSGGRERPLPAGSRRVRPTRCRASRGLRRGRGRRCSPGQPRRPRGHLHATGRGQPAVARPLPVAFRVPTTATRRAHLPAARDAPAGTARTPEAGRRFAARGWSGQPVNETVMPSRSHRSPRSRIRRPRDPQPTVGATRRRRDPPRPATRPAGGPGRRRTPAADGG